MKQEIHFCFDFSISELFKKFGILLFFVSSFLSYSQITITGDATIVAKDGAVVYCLNNKNSTSGSEVLRDFSTENKTANRKDFQKSKRQTCKLQKKRVYQKITNNNTENKNKHTILFTIDRSIDQEFFLLGTRNVSAFTFPTNNVLKIFNIDYSSELKHGIVKKSKRAFPNGVEGIFYSLIDSQNSRAPPQV